MFAFPMLCRFCTKKTNLLYNLDDENSSLIGKLASLAPDTIEFNELLPQKICQNCHDKLNETYTFQQQIYQVFKLYKKFIEYQQSLGNNEEDGVKTEPFEYLDEDFISDDFRQCLNNLGNTTNSVQLNQTFIKLPNAKKPTTRKPENVIVKRKRGRPKKYSGLMKFKNDDLTDVEKMKNVVVNSVPNIDPDYEPETYFEQPLMINLHKKRGRPKNHTKQEKENETFIITEQVHQVYDVPNEPGTSNQDPNTTKVCGFAAKSQEYLNRHMARHDDSDENKIECTICKKLLKTRNSFKIHMKRHEDDRRFECSLCDKKYVVKSQLDIHFRIHTGFKPFTCRFCGKQFRKADPFKNHVRIHTNEKPFVCHYCNKKFTQKVSLQVHLRLHTGERPYNCGECGKTFIQCSVYKLHMKRYHPVPVIITAEALIA